MQRFFDALTAGMPGLKKTSQPTTYTVGGKAVQCPHCGGSKFTSNRALLNSRGLTAFGVDWLDASASVLICADCGRIEWYAQTPTRVSE